MSGAEKFLVVLSTVFIVLVLIATAQVFQARTNVEIVTCAKDVKVCSDGSYVERVAPFCQFALCFDELETANVAIDGVCVADEDCVHFGKTGDCNCGCYTEENLPGDTGGECFCLAPTSCRCVEEKCEGVF